MNELVPIALGAAERAVQHLDPEIWAKVNRHLVRKAIAEFAHERLIEPRLVENEGEWARYALDNGDPNFEYGFRARRLSLDHWLIDEDSLEKRVVGLAAPIEAADFILEFQDALGIKDGMAPIYLEEISSTLYGAAFKEAKDWLSAEELTRADYQAVESAMSEGHPTFVANNGRIGFDASDYRAYTPEAGSVVRLVWLAVAKACATFTSLSTLDYRSLMAAELGPETLRAFEARLRALALDPADYLYLPAHPWQWFNKLAVTFAADVATRKIVCLGQSEDRYLPQQSIRTFFNVSRPDRHYVKTAISVLNMGFMRGLSPKYMVATPAINEWLWDLVAGDPFFRSKNFSILREVAAIGYRYSVYDEGLRQDSAYKKMLAALWRESPMSRLKTGERLMTMASLLHVDPDGDALLPALIAASGLEPDEWLRRYLDAYLAPLVHAFYAHDLAFMPHGENLIMVLKDNAPVGMLMKDIGEEIGVLNATKRPPKEIERIDFRVREDAKLNCIFTDVFDCFFRYLSATLVEHCGFADNRFWRLVAECVQGYLDAHPGHAEKAKVHDLFAETFIRNCLNRLQLNDNQQMLDLLDPEKSLQFVGTLDNPLAAFAKR
ncbi:IucA/IucC family protein [Hansschlegelia zhihuaiae]|uniref:IucA/IucC family siderophore biosynthesis protein n=1 Tax=Hansschlegelia zhihuaiae TaxID=405005 RepID=A0A4V1KJH5_9HYPH|nr:IucA/IucC family siderophore biosynthesis protein [Hansschlegelia zhihuaiae]RXF74212.1 IucA/IucC family siderophore biosynthesis protein [Hansschlegelia zhihuaiae]